MADVYSRSSLTLVAATSANAGAGLFQHVPNHLLAQPTMIVAKSIDDKPENVLLQARYVMNYTRAQLQSFPLMKRAWAFQERYLSPRLLYFLEGEIAWRCEGAVRKEDPVGDFETGITSRSTTSGDSLVALQQHWQEVVIAYTDLSLTFVKDKLPAIGGVATQLQQMRNGRYYAGIWEDSLLYDLSWVTAFGKKLARISYAPSWS
jgi:hypothetical protein